MSVADDICLFDFTRSTKCASKQRRDQINSEIGVLRDLLPLPESARVRLSQLQIMSLNCVYIRKCALLQRVFGDVPFNISTPFDFCQALSGFLLVTTQEGKLVYISENVTEHLGHSMVDMKMQGDSIYDIIDKRDHLTVEAQLTKSSQAALMSAEGDVSFFCRMNMSRCLKRQSSPADIKIMHVKGHFKPIPSTDANSKRSLFMAICSPLLTPDVKENAVHHNTMTFKTTHSLDMRFKHVSQNGEHHLGLTQKMLLGQSWYGMVHPEDVHEARDKHTQLLSSQSDHGCLLTIRMISGLTETIWVNVVMSVQHAQGNNSREPTIVCVNQVISEEEAGQFKMHSQVYNIYQSRGIDVLCNNTFTPLVGSSSTVLDRFMDSVSEHTSPVGATLGVYPTPLIAEVCMSGGELTRDLTSTRKIEHAQTMQALKRKLGENATSAACKPRKISRFNVTEGGSGKLFDGGLLSYLNSLPMESGSLIPSPAQPMFVYDYHCYDAAKAPLYHSGGVYNNLKESVRISEDTKASTLIAMEPLLPLVVDITRVCKTTPEQVVPEWYLTPEASPTTSPHNNITDADVRAFAKSLDAKLQMEFKSELKKEKACAYHKLPVIDASIIDEFFDQVASPTKSTVQSPPPSRERSISVSSNQVAPDNSCMAMNDLFDLPSFMLAETGVVKQEAMYTLGSPSYILGSPESLVGDDFISEEEAQATLSLLHLPGPLLAPHRNLLHYNQSHVLQFNRSHIESLVNSPTFERTCH